MLSWTWILVPVLWGRKKGVEGMLFQNGAIMVFSIFWARRTWSLMILRRDQQESDVEIAGTAAGVENGCSSLSVKLWLHDDRCT